MPEIAKVGMGEYVISRAPGEIVVLGLGSCVGVCIYDPLLKLGAVAHVMLPDSRVAKTEFNPAKFADTAVPFLLSEMERYGASDRGRLQIKLVGGARMFASTGHNREIGARNIAAVEAALAALGLSPAARSVGGTCGKSLALNLETGELKVRTLQVESLRL
ncbi:MAG: chemotaxis protein CheD [Patescibacteria group bacterium]